MQTRNKQAQGGDYYSRESHRTSMQSLIAALFGSVGGVVSGGLVDRIANGVVVWLAGGIGFILGVLVYSMCVVAGEASDMEERIAQERQNGEES